MAARALACLLLLSGCAAIGDLEAAGAERARQPIIVPIAKGTLSPLCVRFPLLFWEKPKCA